MTVEKIGSSRIRDFLTRDKAVLTLLLPACFACEMYKQVIEDLSRELIGVRFGRATVGKRRLFTPQALQKSGITTFPTTIIIKNGAFGCFFKGYYGYEDACEIITGIFNSDEAKPDSFIARIHNFSPGTI